jgi:hypothetical protein
MWGKRDIPVAPRIPTLISCLVAVIVYSMKRERIVWSSRKVRDGGFRVSDSELRQLMGKRSTLDFYHCSIIHIDI